MCQTGVWKLREQLPLNTLDPQISADAQVIAVTVTYGDRWTFLSQLLAYLESHDKVAQVIVIDNGARQPIGDLVKCAGLRKPMIVRHEHNLGSAAGFKVGLERALAHGAPWIWILDDDNLPESSTLETLLLAAADLAAQEQSRCAFLAYRAEHQKDIESGVAIDRCIPTRSSFCGFQIFDVPYKIWRRLPCGRPTMRHAMPSRVVLPFAPYSGLFFHRKLLEEIGMPETDFVLYADDTEFSFRISEAGGQIFLLTDAPLREMEPSWNSKGRRSSSFESWLLEGSDTRAFYGSRNQAYFDSHFWVQNRSLYRLNKTVYLLAMRWYAWRHRRFERYALIRRAIALGEGRELGLAADYPLP